MRPAGLLGWVRARDGGLLALRRAARAAIVMPGLFALSVKVIGNPTVAAFAAFGSFAMLLLASFGGPLADRLRVAGRVRARRCGPDRARNRGLDRRLAGSRRRPPSSPSPCCSQASSAPCWPARRSALLIAFILPTSLPGSISTVPDRLAGWGMAAGAALIAVDVLWPVPSREPLRAPAVAAVRALAARLRAHLAYLLGEGGVTRAILDARGRARRRGGLRARPRVLRHAVPADRADDVGALPGAAGRRDRLAERDRAAVDRSAPAHPRRPDGVRREVGGRRGARVRCRDARGG